MMLINFTRQFITIFIFIYAWTRTLYRMYLVTFQESYTYPRDITLDFFGCEPLIWREADKLRISGLPKYAVHGTIGVENRCTGKITSFHPEDGFINWKNYFEDISKTTYYDDLE